MRKVLGHGYAEVDDRLVVAHLAERGRLRQFVSPVAKVLDDAP